MVDLDIYNDAPRHCDEHAHWVWENRFTRLRGFLAQRNDFENRGRDEKAPHDSEHERFLEDVDFSGAAGLAHDGVTTWRGAAYLVHAGGR